MLHRSTTDRLFHALGDPTRRAILEHLGQGPLSAGEIASRLPVTLTAVGQHLRVLEASGLIRTAKAGRVRTAEIRREGFEPAGEWIDERRNVWARPPVRSSYNPAED